MKGINGREKGAGYERKLAKVFRQWAAKFGVKCEIRRTPQSGGWSRSASFQVGADLVCSDKRFRFSIEAKDQEEWNFEHLLKNAKCKIFKWWKQTIKECVKGKTPLLVFHKNFDLNYVMVRVRDYKKLTRKKLPQPYMMLSAKHTGRVYIAELGSFLRQVDYK